MIRAGRFYAVIIHSRDPRGRPRVGYRVHDDVAGVVRTVYLSHGSARSAKADASAEVAKLHYEETTQRLATADGSPPSSS